MPPHARAILGHLRRLAAPADSDAALLARWLERRDESAFAALVARHGPMVLSVCRRVLGDEHTAEDAFQATFLVLARKASALRRPEALPSFLFGVALRLARKSRGSLRRWMVQTHPDVPEPADPHPHPLDALTGRELLALLDEEVARLPEVYRLPLLLCVMQGRTVEEAERLLGWSNGSLRGRLARGREKLRERLARRGLAVSVGALALLAPAAVPEHLRAAALRNLAVHATPAVSALAAAPALKLKAVCFALFMVIAAGLGASLPFLHGPNAESPAATPSAPPPAQANDEPRRDRYGDPLPPGAIARLGTLRYRAPDTIETLAFAPDGKTLAVYSHAGLFLMDAASGKVGRQLPTPNAAWGAAHLLIFSPDSKRLLAREQKADGHRFKGIVRVWELAGDRKPREHDAEHAVWVGWSAEGEPLAVCLEKEALCLRELASGRSRRFECKDLRKPELFAYVSCVCAPAGKTLAVADDQNRIYVWDTANGRERCIIQPKNSNIRALVLSADGRTLATLSRVLPAQTESLVQLWDAATGEALRTVADKKTPYAIAFTPDGKSLATIGWRDVHFWEVTTGRQRSHCHVGGSFAEMVAFSADGKTLATAERHSGAIQLWDIASGKPKPQPAGHRSSANATFSPDGRRVATGGGLDGSIYIWDLANSKPLTQIQRRQWVRNCAFSPNGRLLFSTGSDEELWVSDAANGERLHVLKIEDPDRPDTYQSVISMYRSRDGKTLVVLSYYYARKNNGGPYQDTLITGWDTSTRKQLFRRRRPVIDSWVALSADARVLAVPHPTPEKREMGTAKGPMHLEDAATGDLLLSFPTLEGQTWPLAFSPDGRLLASNNSNYKLKDKKGDPASATGSALHLWETATAAEVLTLPLESQHRVAFSPDGRLLASIAPSQEIRLYDLARGRELKRFKGFNAGVTHLAFSPDGRRLISGLDDSTLLVWDVGAPEPLPARELGADAAAKAWADLAGADAVRAFRARWALVSVPEETIALLKEHLHPVRPADPKRLRQLLSDLESEQFATREKAQAALAELGDLAAPSLRQTLADKPTLEVRRRVQALLDRLRGPVKRPEMLRSLRAVAVLEDIGTPEARRRLEDLAKGADGARLTREAKASLNRLEQRTARD
jgi:RNA polymerase sigma factor (sigma-70 family)